MSRDPDILFQQVLAEHGAALRRLAGTYEHEPARAEDLYQEICLALWQALPRRRGESSLRTFVFRIAHNRGLTHGWRESKRTDVPLQAVHETADPTPSAEDSVERRQRSAHLLAAVRELSVGLRQAVSLRLEGFSSAEIAEILGLSQGTVRVRLHRAQNILARRIPSLSAPTSGDTP